MLLTKDREYNLILFDLDGTVTDSKPGIVNSVKYALKSFGIEEKDEKVLQSFIGPPLVTSFQKYYGFSDKETAEVIEKYREYYKDKGIYENTLYDGIEDVIKASFESSKKLVIATAKPTVFAKKVLEHHSLDQYFKKIVGSNLDGTRVNKDEIIGYIKESVNSFKTDSTLMIGDRKYDIDSAHQFGIDSIGVLYGYGSETEIESCNPTFVINTPCEILEIINVNR
ncbi:MAG: HAD family hydrolase [Clostridiales bacterium]|nr:HAD family hydrolase [Clostridiales bacterium]